MERVPKLHGLQLSKKLSRRERKEIFVVDAMDLGGIAWGISQEHPKWMLRDCSAPWRKVDRRRFR